MSTAEAFLRLQPLPFCIETIDLDALGAEHLESETFFVRGLSLEEAMHLYYNWETLTLGFSITGVNIVSSGDPYSLSCSFPAVALAGTVTSPRRRGCATTFASGAHLLGLEPEGEPIPEDPPNAYDAVAGFALRRTFGIGVVEGPPEGYPALANAIFKDAGGDHVFAFALRAGGSGLDANSGLSGRLALGGGGLIFDQGLVGEGDPGSYSARIGDPVSVPLLGGSFNVWPYFLHRDVFHGEYVSGGSLDVTAFTPGFFTYDE